MPLQGRCSAILYVYTLHRCLLSREIMREEGLTLQTMPRGSSGLGTALFSRTLAPFRSLCRSPRE